jgi:hypothetical protein
LGTAFQSKRSKALGYRLFREQRCIWFAGWNTGISLQGRSCKRGTTGAKLGKGGLGDGDGGLGGSKSALLGGGTKPSITFLQLVSGSRYIRSLVSKKRRRMVVDGYDLDLSYITDRLLAMSFPAQNMEAIIRNPMWQVQRALDSRHGSHYKVNVKLSFMKWLYQHTLLGGRCVCCRPCHISGSSDDYPIFCRRLRYAYSFPYGSAPLRGYDPMAWPQISSELCRVIPANIFLDISLRHPLGCPTSFLKAPNSPAGGGGWLVIIGIF